MKYFAAIAAALLLQTPAAAMNAELRTALSQAADLVAKRYVDPVSAFDARGLSGRTRASGYWSHAANTNAELERALSHLLQE